LRQHWLPQFSGLGSIFYGLFFEGVTRPGSGLARDVTVRVRQQSLREPAAGAGGSRIFWVSIFGWSQKV
jgi:hypothetical protein